MPSLTPCDEALIIIEHAYELYLRGDLSAKIRPEWNDKLDMLLQSCLKDGYTLPRDVKNKFVEILPYLDAANNRV